MALPAKPHSLSPTLGQRSPIALTPRNAMLAVLLCLCVGGAMVWWRSAVRITQERDRAQGWAQGAIGNLESVLNRALYAAEALAVHVRATGGHVTTLQSVAGEIMLARPGLISLEIQPGGVTTDVAPRAGNERAMGLSVLRDPAAVAAYRSRKLIASGPLLLPRGQPGVVARLPIFVRDAKGKESFWGFVTASVALPDVMTEARLSVLASQGYDYLLYAAPPTIKPVKVAWHGDPDVPNAVQQSRTVADLQFHLAVIPHGGWVRLFPLLLETIAVGLLAAAMGLYLQLRLKSSQLQEGWSKYTACLTEEHERSIKLAEELQDELRRTTAANAAEVKAANESVQAVKAQFQVAEDQTRLSRQRVVEMEEQLRQTRAAYTSESAAARNYGDALRTQLKQTEEELRVALEQRTRAENDVSQTQAFQAAESAAARSEAESVRTRLKQTEEELRLVREQRTNLEEALRQTRGLHAAESAAARSETDVVRGQLAQRDAELLAAREQKASLEEELARLNALSLMPAPQATMSSGPDAEPPSAEPQEIVGSAAEETVTESVAPESVVTQPAAEPDTPAGAVLAQEQEPIMAETTSEANAEVPSAPKLERPARHKKLKDSAQLNLFGVEAEVEAGAPVPPLAKSEAEPPANRRVSPRSTAPVKEERSRSSPSAHDLADFKKTASILYTLLAESDPGAIDCLSDHAKQLRPLFPSDAFETFEKLVSDSAFAEALDLLVKTSRRHGVNL